MSTSVISHPSRGKWGQSSWRGNCSGYVYQDIFQQLQPQTFCDPMVGSGTSVEVAQEMGIEAFGLDLHSGFNVLRHSILDATVKPVDLCLSHPPYHDMIVYSGNVYPGEHPETCPVALIQRSSWISSSRHYSIRERPCAMVATTEQSSVTYDAMASIGRFKLMRSHGCRGAS